MGASHKEAARKFMREHPGTTFPAAKRASVAISYKSNHLRLTDWLRLRMTWNSGLIPPARSRGSATSSSSR
jgi:hypothetical protein